MIITAAGNKKVKKSLLFFTLALGFLISSITYTKVCAQLFPMPPLFKDKKTDNDNHEGRIIRNDQQPPTIQFLTTNLTQGKNVLRLKITDQSGIMQCEIKYATNAANGKPKTADCVYDHDNIYKSLISSNPPSQVVEVYATDPNGNSATTIKNFVVTKQTTLSSFFSSIFSSLLHSFKV